MWGGMKQRGEFLKTIEMVWCTLAPENLSTTADPNLKVGENEKLNNKSPALLTLRFSPSLFARFVACASNGPDS